MKTYSTFDIIGPRMIGPSSSHTAGAAKLGYMAWKIAGRDVKRAVITLYGSFARTGRGHGTDKALVAAFYALSLMMNALDTPCFWQGKRTLRSK